MTIPLSALGFLTNSVIQIILKDLMEREVEHYLVHRIEINSVFMYCFKEQKENLYNSVMKLNGLING